MARALAGKFCALYDSATPFYSPPMNTLETDNIVSAGGAVKGMIPSPEWLKLGRF